MAIEINISFGRKDRSTKPANESAPRRKRRLPRLGRRGKRILLGLIILALLGGGVYAGLQVWHPSPVPAAVRNQVSFPVYYPDQKKLPPGYTLNRDSFSAGKGAVIYTISTAGQRLVVTVQPRISDDQLAIFYKNQMPLHNDVEVSLGKAAIGAIREQTVASLPAPSAWVLVTGPGDTDQEKLKAILRALRR